ncbi:STAS domain-containing protein [Kitasatospora paranensis]|uniref:STAS domain-containing protein n=1 Tax=Kitasatospora paranensis TaxID=258053 RepID=A0ABW2FYH8_9ACTN
MIELAVEIRAEADGLVIVVTGSLDYDQAAPLDDALQHALTDRPAPGRITVDMAGVTFCDSAGLNGLLLARRRAEQRGIPFVLARPSPAVTGLLHTTGADEVFVVGPGPGAPGDAAPGAQPRPET